MRYLRVGPIIGSEAHGYVKTTKNAIEWVDSPDDATAEDRTSAQIHQHDLKVQLDLETTLIEREAKWIVCRED